MDLVLIKYFVILAEELHFSRTASRLNISQSTLSEKIKTLETETGVRLFERNKHRVTLTAAGSALLLEAPRLLEAAEQTLAAVRRAEIASETRLVVGLSTGLPYTDLLLAFRSQHPGLHVTFRENWTGEVAAALDNREIDLAFLRCTLDRDDEIERVEVGRERFVVWLPKGHEASRYEHVPLFALRNEKLLLAPRQRSPWVYDLTLEVCRQRGYEPAIEELDHTTYHPMLSAVAAGIGVAIVPESKWQLDLGDIRVTCRPLTPPEPWSPIQMAWRKTATNPWIERFAATVPRLSMNE